MQEAEFITTFALTLERLKKLPLGFQALLLLKRLRRSFRDHKAEPQRFNKNNFLNRAANMVDPYGLASGFPQPELGQIVKHLLGAPWFRLEQDYYIVNTTGDGWYEITDEGMSRSNDEFPAVVDVKQESDHGVNQFKGWEKIRDLGMGGQSTVYLVRTPQRSQERRAALDGILPTIKEAVDPSALIERIGLLLREDYPKELGALKVFDKTRLSGAAPEDRIRREIEILGAGHANLPKLLASDLEAKWMVTEYFPLGSLDYSPTLYRGDVFGALNAFRPLVETVKQLHSEKIIHRDIKPANVFIGRDGQLKLGDFGIAFRPDSFQRLTVTLERVGPRDYMPPWSDTGERLGEVKPNFDIYMLGKLLWCMVAGKLKLFREHHRRDDYNISKFFPNDRRMHSINLILDRCVVEYENECLQSAQELLDLVDATLESLNRGLIVDEKGEISVPCLVCAKGLYVEDSSHDLFRIDRFNTAVGAVAVRMFSCNVCTHRAFFTPGQWNDALRPTPKILKL